jgi:iron complex outermembrane receptor protein
MPCFTKKIVRLMALPMISASLFVPFAHAQDIDALEDISLENLGNVVTSVSKRPEDPFKSAAAIYVITQEDIRTSGATHIAEVLRGVPGLQVAHIDSSNWAISSRGFSDNFANKLLVIVDGRTVYTPLFSGVYWDIQDVVLEDVERVEVIRGPGAALWGANAVNGVINIITKRAEKTQGTYVSQLVGGEDKSITEARYGGASGDNLFYRTHIKYARRDGSDVAGGSDANNTWNSGKAGFRVDNEVSPDRKITVQGDAYNADIDLDLFIPSLTTPPVEFSRDSISSRGMNVLGRWQESHGNGFDSTFQLYYDFQSPDYISLSQDIHTVDFDYQTSWKMDDRNHLVWGGGYRLIDDEFENSSTITLTPDNRTLRLYSAFVQDTIAIVHNLVDLTVGSKFEHNDYTGFEFQPSARIGWYPTQDQTVWGSVGRAVRTPSRAENDMALNVLANPPAMVQQQSNRGFESEELIAYEAGYRVRPTTTTSLDIATFYNDYDELRTFEFGAIQVDGAGNVIAPAMVDNLGKGHSYGAEVSATWDVNPKWSLSSTYSYLKLNMKLDPASSDVTLLQEETKAPDHQFSIRSHYYFTDNIEMTNTAYYVDDITFSGVGTFDVDDYVRFDTRLAWKPTPGMEFSIVGQNLLDDKHPEFAAPLHGAANEIERAVYGKISLRY